MHEFNTSSIRLTIEDPTAVREGVKKPYNLRTSP